MAGANDFAHASSMRIDMSLLKDGRIIIHTKTNDENPFFSGEEFDLTKYIDDKIEAALISKKDPAALKDK